MQTGSELEKKQVHLDVKEALECLINRILKSTEYLEADEVALFLTSSSLALDELYKNIFSENSSTFSDVKKNYSEYLAGKNSKN